MPLWTILKISLKQSMKHITMNCFKDLTKTISSQIATVKGLTMSKRWLNKQTPIIIVYTPAFVCVQAE